jgi:DNA N-6-adenine-methyltransferase (Dam)
MDVGKLLLEKVPTGFLLTKNERLALAHRRAVKTGRSMPKQKPGRSEQTVATPRDFLDAVETRFGKMTWDLAATADNCVIKGGLRRFGPDHPDPMKRDAFTNDWSKLKGNLWCNPPFGDIAPWAKKCRESVVHSGAQRIFLLVPASVGSNWFREHVFCWAQVLFLSPRLTFVGHTQAYPKDLMLAIYGPEPAITCWRWK